MKLEKKLFLITGNEYSVIHKDSIEILCDRYNFSKSEMSRESFMVC